jgi:hypothetical protein
LGTSHPLGAKSVSRKLFNHLFVELSVSIGKRVPRYALWLELHDLGWNPESLRVAEALAFCDGPMEGFLTDRGMKISQRARKRLRGELARFDPTRPLPQEIFERLCGS